MSSIWGAYIEDFNLIKIIIPESQSYDELWLENCNTKIPLIIISEDIYCQERHLYVSYEQDIFLNLDYNVYINDNLSYHLSLGKITRSPRFDKEFYYGGPLGIEYHKSFTIFRIWSPVAKEINLCLNDEIFPLEYKDKGLWEIKVKGNLDKYRYYYLVRINTDFIKSLDPYAISSASNNEYNYVIDLNRTLHVPDIFKEAVSKQIIYEMNFRDMCGNLKNDESAYLKSLDHLEYIKNLKITHLQLMPTFCFGGVNEDIKDHNMPNFKYNWGYNPIQYNIPSGWYASSPSDPYTRINEFKTFITKCKEYNMGVNMDVVFNHVYQHETFSLGLLVPGYVYRTNESGFLMNSSYCGNDLRTEALMIRKFIIDNLIFLQNEYKIDGFRFDLMGLIDVDTMKEVNNQLRLKNPNVLLYGEGWYMNTTLSIDKNANLSSAKYLYPIAFFNDYFRNEISGSLHGNNGFIHGNHLNSDELQDLLCRGSMKIMPFKDYSQSINYIECHDNLTFYDKTKQIINKSDDYIIPYLQLGIGLVLISEGISLIHAGEELCRTKKGEHNSYNLSDEFNHIPWENRFTKYDLSNYMIALISALEEIPNKYKGKLYDKIGYYEIRYGADYQVIINNNFEDKKIYFSPDTVLIFNNIDRTSQKCEILDINKPGIWILKK